MGSDPAFVMKRVLIAGLFHETHTFLDGTTGLGDFQVVRGGAMLACEGDSSPLGGVLACAKEFGWEVLPTIDYRAQPSAMVEDAVIEAFWADFVQHATPYLSQGIDAIYLVLHGAMTSQSLPDVEGEILERLRALPGLAEKPLFGVFDLHANFSHRMSGLADCLVGYRENPHTDARDAGIIAARLLQRSMSTGERPRQYFAAPAIVWPPTGTATANEPMKTLEAMARQIERDNAEVWSVSVVAGFAFADTEDTGVSFVIAMTGPTPAFRDLVDPMIAYARQFRELGNVIERPLSEVMPQLSGFSSGLTVLVEPSDNIGGGAPGNGTGLLRALVEWQVGNSAVCIADGSAVEQAKAAGIGATLAIAIGGRGSRLDAGPVVLSVEVVAFSDGRFELEDKQSHLASMCGDQFDMGPCAVVRHAGITILLTSVKTPPFDLGQWRSQGIEPAKLSVIVVKAAVAHRRAYDPIAARMLWVDTPGPCSSNLKSLPYQKIRRPIYPLDP